MKRASIYLVLCVVLLFAAGACSLPAGQAPAQPAPGVQQGRDQQQAPGQQPVPEQQPIPEQQPVPEQQPIPDTGGQPGAPAPFKVTGIWTSQVSTEYGTVFTQLILEPTGTFSQQVVLGSLMTYDVGTYVVGEGYIHFTVTDHEPKEYQGKPMHWVTSFTYFFTAVDPDTMQVLDRITGNQWTMHRQ